MTEKENHLPNLSSEERAHALELAIQARRRYAALKARVKSGELTFTDAMDEEDAKRILVTSLLQSVPGIGASKAVVIMRLYRIPKVISSTQMMGTRGGGTSGSWFPGKPETPQKRHGKGCGGTPFSMPFLLSH